MPSVASVTALLDKTDWNFPKAGTKTDSIHSFHWFPGNFIPQIPSHLIQILTDAGDLVLDPFGGSGTTAVEALRLGRRVISSDLIRACVFIAEGKVAGLATGLSGQVKHRILEQLTWPELCQTDNSGWAGEGADRQLEAWYSDKTLAELRFIWKLIEGEDSASRHILELLFSDVLFACASTGGSKTKSGKIRRHHWGWVADNVRPRSHIDHDAIGAFVSRVCNFPELPGVPAHSFDQVAVARQDAARLAVASGSIDAIITSPPYIGVIDYTRANRLLYLWKGWDLDIDRSREIGARYRRQRGSAVAEYLASMSACWDEFTRVLKPGGYCAIVIGESRRFPGAVTKTLENLSERQELIWGPIARKPSRRRVSDKTGSDALEYLAVYRKQ